MKDLTAYEIKMIQNFIRNDYNDAWYYMNSDGGSILASYWDYGWNGSFISNKKAQRVIISLIEKDIFDFHEDGSNSAISLTANGLQVARKVEKSLTDED